MMMIILKLRHAGHFSDVVLGMYIDSEMLDNISREGWNVCGCDNEIVASKIG